MRTVTLLVILGLSACAPEPGVQAVVSGSVVSGPHCPVETDPPDPACAPRPVADAVIVATADGQRDVKVRSNENGEFSMVLGAGMWAITFNPAEGLLGTPEPAVVVVDVGEPIDLGVIAYDTGIR